MCVVWVLLPCLRAGNGSWESVLLRYETDLILPSYPQSEEMPVVLLSLLKTGDLNGKEGKRDSELRWWYGVSGAVLM